VEVGTLRESLVEKPESRGRDNRSRSGGESVRLWEDDRARKARFSTCTVQGEESSRRRSTRSIREVVGTIASGTERDRSRIVAPMGVHPIG